MRLEEGGAALPRVRCSRTHSWVRSTVSSGGGEGAAEQPHRHLILLLSLNMHANGDEDTTMDADGREEEEEGNEDGNEDSDGSSVPPSADLYNGYLMSVRGQRPVDYWHDLQVRVRNAD